MRRGLGGIGAIQKKKLAESKYKSKGNEIAEDQMQQMAKQFDVFREKLEEFAKNHKNEIKRDGQFRRQFQEMCAAIGVDPLASGKGFWAEKLGFGDFYYELGVQIIEVCLATNHRNGGLMYIEDLHKNLIESRSSKSRDEVTVDDVLRAIKKLKALGNGFTVISVGNGRHMVQSIPGELSLDHTAVLGHAQKHGFTTVSELQSELKWDLTRISNILATLVKDGMAWVDEQGAEKSYWFPGLFQVTE